MAKTQAGLMPCQCCGKEVVVKVNERGTLSYCCQWCDDAPYQKPGTMAFAVWKGKMKPLPGEQEQALLAQAMQQQQPAPAKVAGLLI